MAVRLRSVTIGFLLVSVILVLIKYFWLRRRGFPELSKTAGCGWLCCALDVIIRIEDVMIIRARIKLLSFIFFLVVRDAEEMKIF